MGLDCLRLDDDVVVVGAEAEDEPFVAEEGLEDISQQASSSNEAAFFIRVSSLEVKIPSSAN